MQGKNLLQMIFEQALIAFAEDGEPVAWAWPSIAELLSFTAVPFRRYPVC
jgi:hypothetical protein